MKLLIYLSLALSLMFTAVLHAQKIEGIATYKTQRQMDIQLDSTQMDDGMKQQVMAMMKKQFEKEYTLEFTKDESMYKEVERLESPSVGSGGIQFQVLGSGESDILYKNLKEKRFINQNEMFSKQFLIKDRLLNREWKLEKESKNIGNYSCFKATYTYERAEINSMTTTINEESDEAREEKMETVTVTAWYTPQIPVANGPSEYDGLPGLILEISDGKLSILCSKVVINPSKGLSISKPKGGKEVSQEEYEKIMEKKMKEMEEQFQDSRRGSGDQIEIRIGG